MTWLRNDESVQQIATKKKVEFPVFKKKKKKGKEPEPEPEEFHPALTERLSFDQSKRGETALMVRDSIRGDHGKYTIVVENPHGRATASCEVNVQGKSATQTKHIRNKASFFLNNVEIEPIFFLLCYLQINPEGQSTLNLKRSGTLQLHASGNHLWMMVAVKS